ncbi:MAG: FG-GAP repeat protein [Deltaproteobacteria bacterium]|nr:FG-GAP repeat protein [Deltaproteobacteria bacterium]
MIRLSHKMVYPILPLLMILLTVALGCGKGDLSGSSSSYVSEEGGETTLLAPPMPTDPTPNTTSSAIGISAPYEEDGRVILRSQEAFKVDGKVYNGEFSISIDSVGTLLETASAEEGTFEVTLKSTSSELQPGTVLCISIVNFSGCIEKLTVPEIGLLSISPVGAEIGEKVVFEGNRFHLGGDRVFFNGVSATDVSEVQFIDQDGVTNSIISATVPEGATSGPVWIEVSTTGETLTSHKIPFRVLEVSELSAPLEVDPGYEAFGSAMTFLDFDGSGIDDIVIGDPKYDDGDVEDVGIVVIYRDGNPNDIIRIRGEREDERFGVSLAKTEIHGEALVVSALGPSKGTGSLHIFYGETVGLKTELLSGDADVILEDLNLFTAVEKNFMGGSPKVSPISELDIFSEMSVFHGNSLGWSIAVAGKIDGDDLEDLIVGRPNWDRDRGEVYILFGKDLQSQKVISHIDDIPHITIQGSAEGDLFGEAVSGLGDVNGDGQDDFMVGAPALGVSYLFLGGNDLWVEGNVLSSNEANGVIASPRVGDRFGSTIVRAGDINQDGLNDILIGAPGDGVVNLFFGSDSLLESQTTALDADAILKDVSEDSLFGDSLAFGDINGDGFQDLFVGGEEKVHVFLINTGRFCSSVDCQFLVSNPDLILQTEKEQIGSGFGGAIAADGDVDGDGFEDFLIGAPGSNKVFLYKSPEEL